MARTIKTAKEGYIFTQREEVAMDQRVWGRVIDTTNIKLYHEVPIEQYEAWRAEMEKLNTENI